MKIRKLILLGILTISVSCGVEDLGQSECAFDLINLLNEMEDQYQYLLGQPDSDGNQQSLEACINRRDLTGDYYEALYNEQGALNNSQEGEGCTADEKSSINSRIDERQRRLAQDIEEVWSQCEDIYGGG